MTPRAYSMASRTLLVCAAATLCLTAQAQAEVFSFVRPYLDVRLSTSVASVDEDQNVHLTTLASSQCVDLAANRSFQFGRPLHAELGSADQHVLSSFDGELPRLHVTVVGSQLCMRFEGGLHRSCRVDSLPCLESRPTLRVVMQYPIETVTVEVPVAVRPLIRPGQRRFLSNGSAPIPARAVTTAPALSQPLTGPSQFFGPDHGPPEPPDRRTLPGRPPKQVLPLPFECARMAPRVATFRICPTARLRPYVVDAALDPVPPVGYRITKSVAPQASAPLSEASPSLPGAAPFGPCLAIDAYGSNKTTPGFLGCPIRQDTKLRLKLQYLVMDGSP